MRRSLQKVRTGAFLLLTVRKKRMDRRRLCALLSCLLLVMSLSACWGRRELNKLAIVLGVGLDMGSQPDTLQLTIQIVKPGELKSGSYSPEGGASKEKAYANIQNTGKSAFSAIRGFTHLSNRRLYFPHNQVLIFSRELAERDIAEGYDAFVRDHETRMNVYLLIARGSASEVLAEEMELEKIPAIHLTGLIENQNANSESMIVTLRDFGIALLSGSTAPLAPMLEMYETSEGKRKARLEGMAVFKDGKMIGELDRMQTRGVMWTTGKAKSAMLTLDTQWGQVVLEIMHSKGRITPVKAKDGTIQMQIEIEEDGFIQSNETTQDMSDLANIEMFRSLARQFIRADIESALGQARLLSADVFGFGEAIRRKYPKEWEGMKDNWDEGFRMLEIDIQVDIKLRSTGGLSKPVVPGGAAT